MTEYATLTELMRGREPGSVKVRRTDDPYQYRVGRLNPDWKREAMDIDGYTTTVSDRGPWLLVSEDPPALDTLRLEIAARVLAGIHAGNCDPVDFRRRHAYALAEADALIEESRRTTRQTEESK